jgi:hypothetical protein
LGKKALAVNWYIDGKSPNAQTEKEETGEEQS